MITLRLMGLALVLVACLSGCQRTRASVLFWVHQVLRQRQLHAVVDRVSRVAAMREVEDVSNFVRQGPTILLGFLSGSPKAFVNTRPHVSGSPFSSLADPIVIRFAAFGIRSSTELR